MWFQSRFMINLKKQNVLFEIKTIIELSPVSYCHTVLQKYLPSHALDVSRGARVKLVIKSINLRYNNRKYYIFNKATLTKNIHLNSFQPALGDKESNNQPGCDISRKILSYLEIPVLPSTVKGEVKFYCPTPENSVKISF